MLHSTADAIPQAIPFSAEEVAVLTPLFPLLTQIAQTLLDFRSGALSPKAVLDFESALADLTRGIGRVALDTTFNSLEPQDKAQVPPEILYDGARYRCRGKSPCAVDSTFGTFTLQRWLYEPREPGERCLFPLEHLLGLVDGRATPVLAHRVGDLVGHHTQREVLDLLQKHNRIKWSHRILRQVAAAVAAVAEEGREAAQAKKLIGWLREAFRGQGKYEPVLAVGRDGVMTPICGCSKQQEAAVGTLSVYDRHGKRLGTVYLGWMPQALQETLTRQLTGLINAVLRGWKGQRPRLAYITDSGSAPEGYYKEVLRKMDDPRRPGERLHWQRVVDYYHASLYVSKLAETLFGETVQANQWAGRMRQVLLQVDGLTRLLQSASYYRNQQKLTGKRQQEFQKAYNYLHKRRKWMDYAAYRAKGVPIGSGVTEAGCKVVVSQRLKRSGMKWGKPGGQVAVTLRVVRLSGVWQEIWNSYIEGSVNRNLDTYKACLHPTLAIAA